MLNWHEFSHLWRNINYANEFEADKNAVMIYLGMGNPILGAYEFLKVYKGTPSKLNVQRYNALNLFIREFARKINIYPLKVAA